MIPDLAHSTPELQPTVVDGSALPSAEPIATPTAAPWVTIFAIPKPFTESTSVIQKNAIRSWQQLRPFVDVLLIGDEPGIAEAARELGVRHARNLRTNEWGTPLLSSAFQTVHELSAAPILAYCNCDVILLPNFTRMVERLLNADLDRFVAFGQRTDLHVERELDFDNPAEMEKLLVECRQQGEPSSIVCKEYFVFNRQLYDPIPDFAVGRGNWDNWMIYFAKQQRLPVVDVTSCVTAIHQSHDYSHFGKSRWQCYVAGTEARENQRLAGGRHVISGSTPTWSLDEDGVRKVRLSGLNLKFWLDGLRFAKLTKELVFGR